MSAIDSLGHVAGCDGMAIPFTIIEPPVLTVNAEGMDSTACSVVPDGYITVTIDGGKASVDTFEVQLTGVDTAIIARDSVLVFEGLEEGGYELVVTEVKTGLTAPCVMMDSVWVTPPPALEAEADEYMKMLACKSDSNGVITLDISGGSGIYKVWVNSVLAELDANNAITGLPAGSYAIVVADSIPMAGADSACTVTLDTVFIDEPDSYLELDATKIQDVSCQEDGMFSVQASGGTPGYKYYAALSAFPAHMLIPDPTSDVWQDDSIFTVTEPGTWVVWVMDAAGCVVGGEYDKNDNEINKWRVPIGEPEVKITVAAAKTEAKCNGDFAMVVVNPDSVTVKENNVVVDRAYTVWFENLAGETIVVNDTLMITGDTTVVAWVKDTESGCMGSDTVMLTQPDPLSADALVVGDGEFTCPSVTEGYLEAMASGGTKPYKYQIWKNGVVKTVAYQNDYSFLAKVNSSYSFVVMDAHGCTDTLDVPVFIESVDSVKIVDIKDVSCGTDADTLASVMIEITGEADHMYKVIWKQLEAESGIYSDSSSWYSPGKIYLYQKFKFDNENFNDIHYEFTVVDSFGCPTVAKDTMTFDQRPTSDLVLTVTEGAVEGCATPVTISAAGGVSPYTFMVDGVETAAGTVMLGGGMHEIVVADAHECTQVEDLTLDYAISMDTTISIYVGDTAHLVYTPAMLDTMLVGGMYSFYYNVDTVCVAELNVTVDEREKMAPVLDTVSPMDTIADNHPMLVITFDDDVTFGEMGYLTMTAMGDTTAQSMIEITPDMINGNTVTVTYDATVSGGLDKNVTYIVQVDSGVIMGDGLAWGGIQDSSWMFTTGPVYATPNTPIVSAASFKVYPNPFNDKIYIDNYDKLTRVIITNIAGQRVMDVKYPEREIRTGNLVSGVYLVSMFTESGLAKTDRIVKR